MTIARFRAWKAEGGTIIPWTDLEATVVEMAALQQMLKEAHGPMMNRVLRAEKMFSELDTKMRLALADLRTGTAADLAEVVAAVIADMHEALNRAASRGAATTTRIKR